MALDWSKEVSLSTIMDLARPGKGGGKGSAAIPTKTTMNLYQVERAKTNLRTAILAGVLVLVIVLAVVKFGVLDPLSTLSQKQAQLERQQQLLETIASGSSGYEEIKELYDAYVAEYGGNAVDAIEVLDMVEERVMGTATVSNITLSGTTLTLTIEGVSLQTVGDLASDVEKEAMVEATNVTSAATQNDSAEDTVATLVVTLVSQSEEE